MRSRRPRHVWPAVLCLLAIVVPALLWAQEPPPPRAHLGRDGAPLPVQDEALLLTFLREADVVESRQLAAGTTGIHRLVLERDGVRLRAAFRAVDEKRERVQLADGGAYAAFYDRAIHEVAAYRLSRLLGFPLIPPAVEYRFNNQFGSLQLWVEDAMTEGERARESRKPAHVAYWAVQQAGMEVFDALIANHDRNTGNSLLDRRGHLWLIDHTRAFQRPRGEMDLSEVSRVPEALLTGLRGLEESAVRESLERVLESLQIAAMFERRDRLIEHLDRLIAERGWEAVVLGAPSN